MAAEHPAARTWRRNFTLRMGHWLITFGPCGVRESWKDDLPLWVRRR